MPQLELSGTSVTVGGGKFAMVLVASAVQPTASVTVIVYDPTASAVISAVLPPLLHAYVNGDVPSVTVVTMFPLSKSQVASVGTSVTNGGNVLTTVALCS